METSRLWQSKVLKALWFIFFPFIYYCPGVLPGHVHETQKRTKLKSLSPSTWKHLGCGSASNWKHSVIFFFIYLLLSRYLAWPCPRDPKENKVKELKSKIMKTSRLWQSKLLKTLWFIFFPFIYYCPAVLPGHVHETLKRTKLRRPSQSKLRCVGSGSSIY